MFLVVAILIWSVLIGLWMERFGPREHALLLAGIIPAVAIQYFIFGPS